MWRSFHKSQRKCYNRKIEIRDIKYKNLFKKKIILYFRIILWLLIRIVHIKYILNKKKLFIARLHHAYRRTRARAAHPWSKYRCGSGLRCPWPFIVLAEHASCGRRPNTFLSFFYVENIYRHYINRRAAAHRSRAIPANLDCDLWRIH